MLAVLALALLEVMFCFSNQDGVSSYALSGKFVNKIIAFLWPDFDLMDAGRQEEITDVVSFVVRKGAHFSEYFLLGVLFF